MVIRLESAFSNKGQSFEICFSGGKKLKAAFLLTLALPLILLSVSWGSDLLILEYSQ